MSWDFLSFVPRETLEHFSGTMMRILLNRSFARLYEVLPREEKEKFDAFLAIEEVDEGELLKRTEFLEKHGEIFKRILHEEAMMIEKEFGEFVAREEEKGI